MCCDIKKTEHKEVKLVRKVRLILLMGLMIMACCGCNINNADPEGTSIVKLTSDEIGLLSLEGKQGVFIMNEDNTFSPLVDGFTGFRRAEEASPDRYLWFTENQQQIKTLIPKAGSEDKIVLLYNSSDVIPEELILERYSYKGFTIGAHLYASENNLHLLSDGTLSGSQASGVLSQLSDEEEYPVIKMNDNAVLPVKNIDNNLKMLLGLEAGMAYDFYFYKGTKYIKMQTVADTQVFQSEEIIRLDSSNFNKTEDGYFYLKMPLHSKSGFWYIHGQGMFEYEG